jgi:hypothetical protein
MDTATNTIIKRIIIPSHAVLDDLIIWQAGQGSGKGGCFFIDQKGKNLPEEVFKLKQKEKTPFVRRVEYRARG